MSVPTLSLEVFERPSSVSHSNVLVLTMMLTNTGDYSHTLILMVVILYFLFNAYATSPLIGSPGEMYDLLKKAAIQRPVEGNQDGSYLTLKSNYALIFGVIQLCSGSGTVFLWVSSFINRYSQLTPAVVIKRTGSVLLRPDQRLLSELTFSVAWPGLPFRSASLPLSACLL